VTCFQFLFFYHWQPANADILVPTLCPCHGCNELVVRAGEPASPSLPFASDRKFMGREGRAAWRPAPA